MAENLSQNQKIKIYPEIYGLLEKVVNEDIRNFTINSHDKNKKGEGFLGEIWFITLTNNINKKVISLAVKQAFKHEDLRAALRTDVAFHNEISFYTIIWPSFQKFQESVTSLPSFNKIPKCFITIDKKYSETLVFENLKYEGFESYDKTKVFDKEHVEMICREYGKFHAFSFAYRESNPQRYLQLTNLLKDVNLSIVNSDGYEKKLIERYERCLNNLCPETDKKTIEKFQDFIKNEANRKHNSTTYKGDYSVILHGDCWSNNIMFKYDVSGKLIDMRLVDFQLTRSGTPVHDLSYCLYAGASKEVLDELDHYLKIYHNNLSETLKAFGYNSKELYPFEALKNDWKQYCILGFTNALMLWRIKLTNVEDLLDYSTFNGTKEDVGKQIFHSRYDEETYKKVTRDLIIHMCENDFL